MKRDILIPVSLIAKARRLGACKDALEWLKAEPRTFTALVTDKLVWGDWAIEKLCSASAREAYCKALAPAQEAYDKTTAPALEAYDKAVASAREAYNKVLASAWEAYYKAIAPAQEAYDKAVASAWEAYYKAIAPSWETYNKAIASARLTALLTLVTLPEEKQ